MADYVPRADGELIPWLTNLKEKLPTYGATLGQDPADVAAMVVEITHYITQHNATEEAKRQAAAAVTLRGQMKAALLNSIRPAIASMKANKNFKPDIGDQMQINGTADAFDPATYKPVIKADTVTGAVNLTFKKLGIDALSIYTRLRGELGWVFLARDTNPPYVDNRPLAQPGKPEAREYKARGVVGDAEVGLDSDIVSVVFGG